MKTVLGVFSVLLLSISCMHAYPSGAPTAACSTMTPNHGSSPSANSPYNVSIASNANRDRITVTVASAGTQFRGILLQARATPTGNPVGSWEVPSGGLYQNLGCNGEEKNALTHTSREMKSTPAEFVWIPSSDGNFTIYATVVTSRTVFYVMIPSAEFSARSSAARSFPSAYSLSWIVFLSCFYRWVVSLL